MNTLNPNIPVNNQTNPILNPQGVILKPKNLILIVSKVTHAIFKNYCYTIIDTENKHAVFIDPAWEIQKILHDIEPYQATPKAILLTHHHKDHVDLAETFAQKFQIPVYMSQAEIDFYHYQCTNLIGFNCTQDLTIPSIPSSPSIPITPIATPGHTYGGVSYMIGGCLFTGDTLFIEGCGVCISKGADAGVLFETLQHLIKILTPETRIYPGHSFGKEPGLCFEELLQYNIYCHIKSKDDFIQFRLRSQQQSKTFNFK